MIFVVYLVCGGVVKMSNFPLQISTKRSSENCHFVGCFVVRFIAFESKL
jgi:hypothetical protein